MKIKHALQEYLPEIEVRKYAPKTIRSYRNNLNLFLRFLDEEADVFDAEDLTLASVRKFSACMVVRGKKGRYVNGLLKFFIPHCYTDQGQKNIGNPRHIRKDMAGHLLPGNVANHSIPSSCRTSESMLLPCSKQATASMTL